MQILLAIVLTLIAVCVPAAPAPAIGELTQLWSEIKTASTLVQQPGGKDKKDPVKKAEPQEQETEAEKKGKGKKSKPAASPTAAPTSVATSTPKPTSTSTSAPTSTPKPTSAITSAPKSASSPAPSPAANVLNWWNAAMTFNNKQHLAPAKAGLEKQPTAPVALAKKEEPKKPTNAMLFQASVAAYKSKIANVAHAVDLAHGVAERASLQATDTEETDWKNAIAHIKFATKDASEMKFSGADDPERKLSLEELAAAADNEAGGDYNRVIAKKALTQFSLAKKDVEALQEYLSGQDGKEKRVDAQKKNGQLKKAGLEIDKACARLTPDKPACTATHLSATDVCVEKALLLEDAGNGTDVLFLGEAKSTVTTGQILLINEGKSDEQSVKITKVGNGTANGMDFGFGGFRLLSFLQTGAAVGSVTVYPPVAGNFAAGTVVGILDSSTSVIYDSLKMWVPYADEAMIKTMISYAKPSWMPFNI